MLVRALAITMMAILSAAPASAQQATPAISTVRLWPEGAPGSEARRREPEQAKDYWVKNVHDPSLTVFRPDPGRANGASIVLVPGGGHRLIVWTTEGVNVARALNRMGITVFVLKYRLANEEGSTYSVARDAAADARRAIRWVRAHSADYAVDARRIGVMGFSAGGELASLVADQPAVGERPPHDAVDRVSARPDFQILVFPGPGAVPTKLLPDAPPAFLVAGSRDECCAAPTVAVYERLRSAGVSAELHMFAEAGHAFNLDETDRVSVLHWPDLLFDWLFDGGWIRGRGISDAPQGKVE